MIFNPIQNSQVSRVDKILNLFWKFLNLTLFRYSPFFMRKFRVFLIKIFGGKIHWTCSLDRLAIIDFPWKLHMDKFSSVGENSWIYCLDEIHIGEFVCIGKDVYLITGSHDIDSLTFDLITKPISIGRGSWISTGSYVLPGIEISEYTVIGAASVVTKNTLPFGVYAGNPAKFIKVRKLLK